ncbi:hypothetical protein EVAR_88598_1 [Eumeta japonica]|uniref:Uncharacterized protein n=1 Tax=Eumeta variegata TaxID=151549 RepID=A0A4C2A4S6_EUMVA|nr:hypothetical protein EVAR_88598_1 [Eumeta japonica]
MSHRTREARRMPCVSLPLNYDRSAARSTRELVHSFANVLQVISPAPVPLHSPVLRARGVLLARCSAFGGGVYRSVRFPLSSPSIIAPPGDTTLIFSPTIIDLMSNGQCNRNVQMSPRATALCCYS